MAKLSYPQVINIFPPYKKRFGHVGKRAYLCIMTKRPTILLKTKTDTLTRAALRLIAKETIHFCIATLGVKRTLPVPTVSVIKRGRSLRYGQYDMVNNHIQIHYNVCGDVKMMIQTLIHEYTHYTQNMNKYHKLIAKYGYDAHPQEVEARNNEKLYTPCFKFIKKSLTPRD
jgi:hypothetical protein